MQFVCSVDINQPIDKVVALFEDPNNLKEWQDGFQRMEHVSGDPGTVGAKSKLFYDDGKRKIELLETITVMNLPDEMAGIYEHKHMTNTMSVRFTKLSEDSTRLDSDMHYTKLNGFLIKLMAKLFPNMFKKQAQKWYDQFKEFAERH